MILLNLTSLIQQITSGTTLQDYVLKHPPFQIKLIELHHLRHEYHTRDGNIAEILQKLAIFLHLHNPIQIFA